MGRGVKAVAEMAVAAMAVAGMAVAGMAVAEMAVPEAVAEISVAEMSVAEMAVPEAVAEMAVAGARLRGTAVESTSTKEGVGAVRGGVRGEAPSAEEAVAATAEVVEGEGAPLRPRADMIDSVIDRDLDLLEVADLHHPLEVTSNESYIILRYCTVYSNHRIIHFLTSHIQFTPIIPLLPFSLFISYVFGRGSWSSKPKMNSRTLLFFP